MKNLSRICSLISINLIPEVKVKLPHLARVKREGLGTSKFSGKDSPITYKYPPPFSCQKYAYYSTPFLHSFFHIISLLCFRMTILIDQPPFAGVEAQEKKVHIDEKEVLLDGGFLVPHTNSFGHTFRYYDAECERQEGLQNFYRNNHINQTCDFVKKMREEYGKLNRIEMRIWECCELLNDMVDESDPDLDEPQIEHLLQTAEAIRKDYPDEDWLHLTGLIHDLGKVLLLPSFGGRPQWAVVGDTFPVGCAFDESIVHHKYFEENPDYNNPAYNTKYGVYSEGCGLNNVMMSWGHDDYMYLVAKENKTTLPSAALFIIRYHSFYALHRSGAYKHLMNEEDIENLKWLQIFNKYDLYSKSKVRVDVEKVKPYYLSLISKYFPAKLKW
ncbi:Inositol oxygenase [Melia azedarach]|uniref:Inositol oxygenase n=1 Tax=Melia azedarach TaxID=155640 RepID=A0ACC1Y4B5_MELAZ|nr:Inositol oxygenase [Melia azedarach]